MQIVSRVECYVPLLEGNRAYGRSMRVAKQRQLNAYNVCMCALAATLVFAEDGRVY